ncbi:MAG: cobaltochelatase subunit CobN, partial [Cyanobacteria bacterium P01_F01_bin.53]
MHRLAATPGGWNSSTEGVVFIDQAPAPIVVLTAADTDISALNQALPRLPKGFSAIRSVNLLQLQQQLTIDTYADDVLSQARLIILRVLGGRAYWSYGLEVVKAVAGQTNAALVVMPGDTSPDLGLMGHSTVPLAIVNQLWQYFTEGGVDNICNGLLYVSDRTLNTSYNPSVPKRVPRIGIYTFPKTQFEPVLTATNVVNRAVTIKPLIDSEANDNNNLNSLVKDKVFKANVIAPEVIQITKSKTKPTTISNRLLKADGSVGILFYRAHYLAGNTKVIESLCYALEKRRLRPVPIYVSSLKDVDVQQALLAYCQPDNSQFVEVLINTTSFAITSPSTLAGQAANQANSRGPNSRGHKPFDIWKALDVPVLQAICSGSPREHWQGHPQGLTPRDIAMNVALPEVDGRIITRAVSFKASQKALTQKALTQKTLKSGNAQGTSGGLQTDVVVYEPVGDRIDFVADLAARWINLRRTPPKDRKVALILANYPNRDGRMANGVGLDTPASCIEILQALQQSGYTVGALPDALPENGDALMAQLAQGITNDPEGYGLRSINQFL